MRRPDPDSPPDLRQEGRRHAGPLIGMVVVVLFAVGLIFYWLAEESAQSPGPEDAAPDTVAPPAAEGEGAVNGDGTVLPAPTTAPTAAPTTGDSTAPAPTTPTPTTPAAPAD